MGLFRSSRSIFEPPSTFELVLTTPFRFSIIFIHHILLRLRGLPSTPQNNPPIRVVCISDTHNHTTATIPDGDLLIHAGDLTDGGTVTELQAQLDWLASFPHKHKVVIAGNHDTWLDPRARNYLAEKSQRGDSNNNNDINHYSHSSLDWHDLHYLQHRLIKLDFHQHQHQLHSKAKPPENDKRDEKASGRRSLYIYGAPQIPACGPASFSFQYPRGQDAWTDTVPNETDVLVTHAPPKYHRDLAAGLGCDFLLKETYRVRPRLHVCGHIHAGRGMEVLWWDEAQLAFERVRARDGRRLVRCLLDVRFLVDVARVVVYGIAGVVWVRVWKGGARGGVLVNAAMCDSKSRFGNRARVIEI